MDNIEESLPGYNHRQINEHIDHNKDTEISFKIKVDSTELDLVLAALKQVSLELDKINITIDSMVKQLARGQVATALHVSLV